MLAPAKINLALVVGPLRPDGKHEVATVLQRIDLADRIQLERGSGEGITVEGFPDDTLVRAALEQLAEATRTRPSWRVQIEKQIPVAAGLGGGSSDAAAVLQHANACIDDPLPGDELRDLGGSLGADVPFFLVEGSQLGGGDGSELTRLPLPCDYVVLLALPNDASKVSTAAVYQSFDARSGAERFEERRAALLAALEGIRRPRDLERLPKNDLVSSPLAAELERMGAFRSDVSGAGPTVYALFEERRSAERAHAQVHMAARTWIVEPLP